MELNPGSRQAGRQADRGKEKKEPYDNITPMDMNMMMNCVARFESNAVVLSLMFSTQSQQGLEATLALSMITHTHTHIHQQLWQEVPIKTHWKRRQRLEIRD